MRPLDAIIVAGGSGARFGAKKQFLDLCGRPVLAHAARSFLDHPAVGRVVVVVP
ncbi:MAG TPA: 2-C-methyl-D-erythritol 4-phosphate cytidylyltransferase, partial [Deltaproteobacteria bacterium]|nr:2-C-methyl-D-erythritol 4-phosphate cytidylyltransferase [Deltaproteobacteria bacterium]